MHGHRSEIDWTGETRMLCCRAYFRLVVAGLNNSGRQYGLVQQSRRRELRQEETTQSPLLCVPEL